MLEAGIAVGIAAFTGLVHLANRFHRRIDDVHLRVTAIDRRVDAIELDMAKFYVPKSDFERSFAKMESHMVRIEEKLDQMMMRNG